MVVSIGPQGYDLEFLWGSAFPKAGWRKELRARALQVEG